MKNSPAYFIIFLGAMLYLIGNSDGVDLSMEKVQKIWENAAEKIHHISAEQKKKKMYSSDTVRNSDVTRNKKLEIRNKKIAKVRNSKLRPALLASSLEKVQHLCKKTDGHTYTYQIVPEAMYKITIVLGLIDSDRKYEYWTNEIGEFSWNFDTKIRKNAELEMDDGDEDENDDYRKFELVAVFVTGPDQTRRVLCYFLSYQAMKRVMRNNRGKLNDEKVIEYDELPLAPGQSDSKDQRTIRH